MTPEQNMTALRFGIFIAFKKQTLHIFWNKKNMAITAYLKIATDSINLFPNTVNINILLKIKTNPNIKAFNSKR